MVQINHSFGANGLTNLGSAKNVQVSGENDKKPQTVVDELKIFKNGKKIYDDGKIDKIILINIHDGEMWTNETEDDGKSGNGIYW